MDTEFSNAPPWVKQKFQPGQQLKHPVLFTFVPWIQKDENPIVKQYKQELAKFEEAHIWELAKKMVNPYEFVHTQENSFFHPSLCILKPLSRSFFKMIEILHVFDFFRMIPKQVPKLRSAHVAEGPGGFIEAFYERSEKEKRLIGNVTAMTLKPTHTNIPGWRRASYFLQKHREIKLHYGPDGTGDLYHRENQLSFIQETKPGAHLFTADGGFDFSVDYDDQEKSVFHLLVCSAYIGIQSLTMGGCFVLKIFDITSDHTRILIGVLSRCFREWMLYKPATSRPCNAERYFLGKGFRGIHPSILETLNIFQIQSAKGLYPISENFFTPCESSYLESHYQEQLQSQIAFLQKGISIIQNPTLWKECVEDHFTKSVEWCSTFQVPVLQKKINWNLVEAVVSQMSERVAAQRLQKPDAEKESPPPSDQALPTSL
jgi:23S rRNA U2552 (ribose-2'-O)-methylase RlmE/FtsJ